MSLAALDLVNLDPKAGRHTGVYEGMKQWPAGTQVAILKLKTNHLRPERGQGEGPLGVLGQVWWSSV